LLVLLRVSPGKPRVLAFAFGELELTEKCTLISKRSCALFCSGHRIFRVRSSLIS
jgi:hypothetical protein